MQEAAEQAHNRGMGLISMCLMSNPEFERVKNQLVNIGEEERAIYNSKDLTRVGGRLYVPLYVQLARDAQAYGVDGVVIGAPSEKNHIKDYEIKTALNYLGRDRLILLPGIGAQGGEAGAIWKHFNPNNVIVNVGRGLMFPNGSESTPEEQAEKAREYSAMLNRLRAVA